MHELVHGRISPEYMRMALRNAPNPSLPGRHGSSLCAANLARSHVGTHDISEVETAQLGGISKEVTGLL